MARVALAVIQGRGSQDPLNTERFLELVRQRFTAQLRDLPGDRQDRLVTTVIVLADHLRTGERDLLARLSKDRRLDWVALRGFLADFFGDAIGYQKSERDDIYRATHALVARELNALDAAAGPDAIFAIAAHGLGSIVASNYIWDLEQGSVPDEVQSFQSTPMARLENLAHLYTLGSPLALWTLRYPNFGVPVQFPVLRGAPVECEWVNFLDDDDVIAYPLKGLSPDGIPSATRATGPPGRWPGPSPTAWLRASAGSTAESHPAQASGQPSTGRQSVPPAGGGPPAKMWNRR
jgi:hypothetical protein